MTNQEYPYSLNRTRAPVSVFSGDRFDTPWGVLTVTIDGDTGDLVFHDLAGAAVPVYRLQFRAHYRANGRQVWPPGGAA